MAMVEVELARGPIHPALSEAIDGVGASLSFQGVVRGTENGRLISGLEYEAYEPMATQQLTALAHDMVDRFGLLAIRVLHSTEFVPAGEISFSLTIQSAHRKEGIQALDRFIDEMKRDIAIWKKPVFLDKAAGTDQ